MKKKLTLLTILVITFTMNSQEYRKYWSDGKLTWSDFKAEPTKNRTINLA